MSEVLNVFQRKQAVMKALVNGIPKNGYNPHHKYHYAADADVLDTMRKLLAEHGLDVTISAVEHNKSGNNTLIMFEIQLTNVDAPDDCIVVGWPGEASDTQDKGTSKAATAALKYWLLKTFLVSTGDVEEDADAGPRQVRNQQPSGDGIATMAQRKLLWALLQKAGYETDEAKDAALDAAGYPNLKLVKKSQVNEIKAKLEASLAARGAKSE